MREVTVGLVSHLVRDYNLGCSALAISNIRVMDSAFSQHGVVPHYRVILPEPRVALDVEAYTSLEGFTCNTWSVRTYPRLKKLLKRPSLVRTCGAFEGCDMIVDLCGGDGYTDNYGLVRLIAESVPIEGARAQGIPMIFSPQTIGPFRTAVGKALAKGELSKLSALFVRDGRSFDCCVGLGLDLQVSRAIDVAFCLPFSKKRMTNGRFNIGLNVSGLLYNGGYNRKNYFALSFSYRDFIEAIVEKLTSDDGVLVHLIPHVISGGGGEGGVDDDYRVCEALQARYPDLVLPEPFDSPIEAKSYISSMDFFSGARMHSTIGAISSGVPVVPIAYSRKFNGLYEALEYPYLIDAKSELTLEDAVAQFFSYVANPGLLSQAVERARPIYEERLSKYAAEFAKVAGL